MKKQIAGLAMMAVVALGITAAAMASDVKYDYDKTVDFKKYKTFGWMTPAPTNGGTLAEARLRRSIEEGFLSKGYKVADDSSKADFVITYQAKAFQDAQINELGRGPRFGRSLYVDRVAKGTLVLDVYNRPTKKLAWRGITTEELPDDPKEADKKAAKVISKLLKQFPPGS